MNQIYNVKTEFLTHIGNKTVRCAHVSYVSHDRKGFFNLYENYTPEIWDTFLKSLDFNYSTSANINGIIYYTSNDVYSRLDGVWEDFIIFMHPEIELQGVVTREPELVVSRESGLIGITGAFPNTH